jgi:hypothetical protein
LPGERQLAAGQQGLTRAGVEIEVLSKQRRLRGSERADGRVRGRQTIARNVAEQGRIEGSVLAAHLGGGGQRAETLDLELGVVLQRQDHAVGDGQVLWGSSIQQATVVLGRRLADDDIVRHAVTPLVLHDLGVVGPLVEQLDALRDWCGCRGRLDRRFLCQHRCHQQPDQDRQQLRSHLHHILLLVSLGV